MATYNITGVVLSGFPRGTETFTYHLSGNFANEAAVAGSAGKAVSLDTGAAGTVKLAGDGDLIFGRIYVAEDRVAIGGGRVASVTRTFKEKLPAAVGHGIVVGDSVVGAGNGLVKKAGAANRTIVIETGADFVTVEHL